MNFLEFIELNNFPKNKMNIEASDRAKIFMSKKLSKINRKGRRMYKFTGKVVFTYKNGEEYEFNFRGNSFKKVHGEVVDCFVMRNNQMIAYENKEFPFRTKIVGRDEVLS